MAIPTITSVTPAQLVSDTREQVIITGTGFNLWTDLPVPNAGVLVFFKFGAEEFLADHLQVISATEIRCQAVRNYRMPTDVQPWRADVRVVNINASGVPIPGETVTLADAVTYVLDEHLPGSTTQRSFLERCLAELLRMLKVSIHANVALATHTDYTPEGMVVHFTTDLPALGVVNITSEKIIHTPYDPDRDRTEGQAAEYLATQYVWLRFQLVPMTDNAAEGLALWEAVARFGQRVRRLHVQKGPGSSQRMAVRLELDEAPVFGFTPSVGTATATFNVKMGPVPIESPEVTDRLYALEDALLEAWANVESTGPSREQQLF